MTTEKTGFRTGSARVITDRLNGRKCFVEETPESWNVVSSLNYLPKRIRSLDPIGVTSFLSNGAIYQNRTIWEGVRSLERASIYRFGPGGMERKSYWAYQFDNAFASRPQKELHRELAELLYLSAKRRVGTSEDIRLSLSGGYDSTCILGLLWKLQPRQVRCFPTSWMIVSMGATNVLLHRWPPSPGFLMNPSRRSREIPST
jgi:asparagine synthase (glutamine-hydrolysing)